MTVPGWEDDDGQEDQVLVATAFTAELDVAMGMEEDQPFPPL
jgi:hypothetical protein